MQYLNNGRWVSGIECRAHTRSPVWGYPAEDSVQTLAASREYSQMDIAIEGHHENTDACDCFCEEYCSRFCPLFCGDFCSEVRDEVCEEKPRKKHKKCGCGCKKRVRLESCRQVACRTCVKVFADMGRVCPTNFCQCFAADFCREFCTAFQAVRRRLCESRHCRREICREGCREICQEVCRCVCRRHCCQIPII